MSQQTERMMEWAFKTVVGVCLAIVAYFGSQAFDQLQDHEVRLSRREANAFTSQDANKLLLAVNQLNFQVAQQQKDLDERKKNDSTITEVLQELKELRRELERRQ